MSTIEPANGHWSLTLPRKREASGALFFDSEGRVLIVKPTYTEGWDFPGGVVDANEPPYAAAAREVEEELGLARTLGRLIAVDWEPRTPDIPIEGLVTVFDGGVLTAPEISAIQLPPNELSAFDICPPHALFDRLPDLYARRIGAAIRAKENDTVAYLENGHHMPGRVPHI